MGGKRQQSGRPTLRRELAHLPEVVATGQLARRVPLAQVDEHALHEQIDQPMEEVPLEGVVALHEQERAQDIVLFVPHSLVNGALCAHNPFVPRGAPDLLLQSSATMPAVHPHEEALMAVSAYILIQTEVGKAAQVATEVDGIDGVVSAEDVTGPYDVIARAEAATVDELGKMVVSRVQMIDGITRTLTCPVVHL